MSPRISVHRLQGADPDVPLPAYATEGAAGADIRANLPPEERAGGRLLGPGCRTLVPTGLAFEIPPGWEVQIRPRSGLALRHGLTCLNSPGTIDADYRGEIGLILVNHGAAAVRLRHGERLAQLVVAPVARASFDEAAGGAAAGAAGQSGTARGAAGFGSTGRT